MKANLNSRVVSDYDGLIQIVGIDRNNPALYLTDDYFEGGKCVPKGSLERYDFLTADIAKQPASTFLLGVLTEDDVILNVGDVVTKGKGKTRFEIVEFKDKDAIVTIKNVRTKKIEKIKYSLVDFKVVEPGNAGEVKSVKATPTEKISNKKAIESNEWIELKPFVVHQEPKTFWNRTKGEVKEASIRVVSKQSIRLVRSALLLALQSAGSISDRKELKTIEKMLKTKFGEAMLATLAGQALQHIPQQYNNAAVQKLAEEMRVEGLAIGGEGLIDAVMMVALPPKQKVILHPAVAKEKKIEGSTVEEIEEDEEEEGLQRKTV